MADVVFFEKPGCRNNTKQKAWLSASGHRVEARNLLAEHWKAEDLAAYFGDRPVTEWFNKAAPAVKAGTVDPAAMTAEAALALMLADPLLIRRPLMRVGPERRAGFDPAAVRAWIGLTGEDQGDMETCPSLHTTRRCPEPGR
ncbi:Nitrogenase-associated protein NifO [Caenispirillum salinarum AK4]|uniref:Nitrogenase-associated protein NifO n=1 Tax=Caenispirillum salinarum AK4 TaxID=1238182 RepID=K9H126_9PROT|nr:ArsC/Spx/MgsR family protein [Caenispirillum salinarum]EKV30734.1 Nitrogenase-associated protein NifO [Caenispirillum salinarum AK4]